MDFGTIAKYAMDLGVIPAVALFLIVSLHRQNKQLIDMAARREEISKEMLTTMIGGIAELMKRQSGGGANADQN
jgi:hypothetical protein